MIGLSGLQLERLHHLADRAHVGFFIVRMVPADMVSARETATVNRQIESHHGAFITRVRDVHDPVVLSAVATLRVEEHDLLRSRAGGFIEDLRANQPPHPPGRHRRDDVYVLAREVVFVGFRLRVFFEGSILAIARSSRDDAACDIAWGSNVQECVVPLALFVGGIGGL